MEEKETLYEMTSYLGTHWKCLVCGEWFPIYQETCPKCNKRTI